MFADGRLGACEGSRRGFVVREVKGPALRFAIGRATRRIWAVERPTFGYPYR